MNNSIETILKDIKKLLKELESSYGSIKPLVCDVTDGECPNINCWVHRSRDEHLDRIIELENNILSAINAISASLSMIGNHKTDNAISNLTETLHKLEKLINPTNCENCSRLKNCKSSYKSSAIHNVPCSLFIDKNENKEEPPTIAIQF